MFCRICDSSHIEATWQAREMQHGLRTSFDYFECAECGCLQIAELPPDMAPYYPPDYYSLRRNGVGRRARTELKLLMAALGVEALLQRAGVPAQPSPPPFIPPDLPRSTRMLDIGAGTGGHAIGMYRSGFRSVHAIDPNLELSRERRFPFVLERGDASTLLARGERFGFVLLSHSLEHMPDQRQALAQVRQLIDPHGICCVRIPWVSSAAWEEYRTDWVQLDAPRHFYLHSQRSFELLVGQAGFRIAKLFCDSTAFQFWASEQYRQDIPLYSEQSYQVAPERSPFTPAIIEAYERRAHELNAAQRGDQIVAWLTPI